MVRGKAILVLLALITASACREAADPADTNPGTPLVLAPEAAAQQRAQWHAVAVDGTPNLWVAGRTALPDCANCHAKDTAAAQPRTRPGERAAHWEISLGHAEGMTCRTCHEAADPATLKALTRPAAFDEAYLLCGTCHKNQLSDWRGGAHGKRLTAVVGPRIIHNCAGCHNPHAPALAKRWPVAYPTIVPARLQQQPAAHEKE